MDLTLNPMEVTWDEPYGKVPMVDRRWTLWKWLEMSENQCPYQNDQN